MKLGKVFKYTKFKDRIFYIKKFAWIPTKVIDESIKPTYNHFDKYVWIFLESYITSYYLDWQKMKFKENKDFRCINISEYYYNDFNKENEDLGIYNFKW